VGKVYKNDEGTRIDLDVGENIQTATTLRINYTKPDGTSSYWTATLVGTSVLRHVTASNELDQAGVWALQAYAVSPAGAWRGETVKLRVYDDFE